MPIKYLHTMVRVKDLEKSMQFYEMLGLVERRRMDIEEGRFTLVFLCPPGQAEGHADVELTYNWDGDDELPSDGRHFGHLAYTVENIYEMCQALMDADHHAASLAVDATGVEGHEPPQPNEALDALQRGGAPFLFNASSELQLLRAARLAAEFNRSVMVLGSGTEFRRLDAGLAAGLPLVLPVNYPEAPDVSTSMAADAHSLRDLAT